MNRPEFFAGVGDYSRPQRHFTVPLKPCGCGVLAGEDCDCRPFAAEYETAPEVHFTAATLRSKP